MSFNRTNRDFQVRVNSLGILKEPLVVDDQNGPKTQQAVAQAMAYMKVTQAEKIFHPAGLNRIHLHWTAGDYLVTPVPGLNNDEADHYNEVFDVNGKMFSGVPALDQATYVSGVRGASHTLSANTGAIGLSVACMGNASYSGSVANPGKWPINWVQIDAMLKKAAEYCLLYDIRVSKWTVLSHAEVQPTLNIAQRGKWDIMVLPDNPKLVLDPVKAGDILRKRLVEKFLNR
jgi:hypothetical protein